MSDDEKPELLRLDSVEWESQESDEDGDEEPDNYPTFLVRGVYLPTGEEFEREVTLELDGRDVDEVHRDGLDLDDVDCDPNELREELYNKIYASEAYGDAARAYHGEPGE